MKDLRRERASSLLESRMSEHDVKDILGHANIKTTDTYLNATRIGLQESMRKYEAFRKTCTKLAQKTRRIFSVRFTSARWNA